MNEGYRTVKREIKERRGINEDRARVRERKKEKERKNENIPVCS